MKTPVALALAVVALMTAGASGQGRMSRTLDIWIKVTAREDGSFTVVNARNNFGKTYAAAQASR